MFNSLSSTRSMRLLRRLHYTTRVEFAPRAMHVQGHYDRCFHNSVHARDDLTLTSSHSTPCRHERVCMWIHPINTPLNQFISLPITYYKIRNICKYLLNILFKITGSGGLLLLTSCQLYILIQIVFKSFTTGFLVW